MSAPAPVPALTLLPPAPARPAQPQVADPARLARVRRWLTGGCLVGALLPVPCVAAGPYLGEAVAAGLVLSWVLLLPSCGLALLLTAAFSRTRADGRALVAVVLALIGSAALVGPAARAGTEAFVASHMTELDAIAAGRAAALASLSRNEQVTANIEFGGTAAGRRLRRLHLNAPYAVPGGLVFYTPAPFTPDVFYADTRLDHATGCARPRVSAVGGRWYLYECRVARPANYDD